MTNPVRIQLSRAKGWRMPSNTVKVDRSTKWGNPYRIGQIGRPLPRPAATRDVTFVGNAGSAMTHFDPPIEIHTFPRPLTASDVVIRFRTHIIETVGVETIRRELGGKDLACWCKPGELCHADVLLEIANG